MANSATPPNDGRVADQQRATANQSRVAVDAEATALEPASKVNFAQSQADPLVRFQELRNAVLVHDVKVFIQGVDVTTWLQGGISITYTNRDGFNTANLTLDNAMDRFVLTEENLGLAQASIAQGATASEVTKALTRYSSAAEPGKNRIARKQREEGLPASERQPFGTSGPEDSSPTFLPPKFRLMDPLGPHWRYSENAKYDIFMMKSGIVKAANAKTREVIRRRAAVVQAENNNAMQQGTYTAEAFVNQLLDEQTSATLNRLSLVDSNRVLTPAGVAFKEQLVEELLVDSRGFNLSRDKAEDIVLKAIQSRVQRDQRSLIAARDRGIDPSVVSAIQGRRDRILRRQELINSGKTNSTVNRVLGRTNANEIARTTKDEQLNPKDSDTGDKVWPLSPRSVIFHKNDPIRIFVKNPFNEDEEWTYAFTGFVDQATVTTNYVTGESKVSVACYDIRALMQKMRISFSPIFEDLEKQEPLFQDRESLFSDLLLPSTLGHAFFRQSVERTVSYLVAGTPMSFEDGNVILKTKKARDRAKNFGVGDYRRGNFISWPSQDNRDPKAAVNTRILELWHTQGFTNKADGSFLSLAEINTIGAGTHTNGQYRPARANLHFIKPPGGTGIASLVLGTHATGANERDWTDRYSVIKEFIERIDYEWLVLPSGDMSFEFPMYDFLPEDFGAYESLMSVDMHLTDGNFTDEQGDIVTAIIATGSVSDRTEAAPTNVGGVIGQQTGQITAMGQSSVLMGRVGVRTDVVALPFVTDPELLKALTMVEFQKRLASVSQMDVGFVYRPYLLPNRPMFNGYERRIGCTSSVTQTWNVNNDANTGVALKYIRSMREDGKFRHVTGGESLPMPWRSVDTAAEADSFQSAFDANTDTSGVRIVIVGDKGAITDQEVPEASTTDSGSTPAVRQSQNRDSGVPRQVTNKGRANINTDDRFVFRLTSYWLAEETTEPSAALATPLLDRSGNVIKEVTPEFFVTLALEGSGILLDKDTLVGTTGSKGFYRVPTSDLPQWNRVVAYLRTRGRKLRGMRARFNNDGTLSRLSVMTFSVKGNRGLGFGQGRKPVDQNGNVNRQVPNIPLDPFRTLAADTGLVKKAEPALRGQGGLVPPGTRVFIEAFKGIQIPGGGGVHDGEFIVNDAGGAIFGAHFDVFTGYKSWRNQIKRPSLVTVRFANQEEMEERFAAAEARVGANPSAGTFYGYGIRKNQNFTIRKK